MDFEFDFPICLLSLFNSVKNLENYVYRISKISLLGEILLSKLICGFPWFHAEVVNCLTFQSI
jgi:hypothetical protein